MLWHIMKIYSQSGYNEFILALGYKGDLIKDYFLDQRAFLNDFTLDISTSKIDFHNNQCDEFKITFAETGLESQTGERILRVKKYITEDEFMVTYGDGVADLNIRALVDFHNSHGRLATVTTVRPISRFGILDVDGGGKVLNFAEKPQLGGWISAGFFVFNRRFFEYLGRDNCILEKDPLERLACEGQLMAYQHRGFFFAMDTYREYKYLNELWDSGKAPWKVWE